jgi:hypothetical protein
MLHRCGAPRFSTGRRGVFSMDLEHPRSAWELAE